MFLRNDFIFQAGIFSLYSPFSVGVIVRLSFTTVFTNQDLLNGLKILLIITMIFSKLFVLALVMTSICLFMYLFIAVKSIVFSGVSKFMIGGIFRYHHM